MSNPKVIVCSNQIPSQERFDILVGEAGEFIKQIRLQEILVPLPGDIPKKEGERIFVNLLAVALCFLTSATAGMETKEADVALVGGVLSGNLDRRQAISVNRLLTFSAHEMLGQMLAEARKASAFPYLCSLDDRGFLDVVVDASKGSLALSLFDTHYRQFVTGPDKSSPSLN